MGRQKTVVVSLRPLPKATNPEDNDAMPVADIDSRYDRTQAFKPAVGTRTHQVVALFLASEDRPNDPLQRVIRLAAIARGLLHEHPLVSGDPKEQVHFIRAGNAAITTLAAAYLNRFQPASPWSFVGSEVCLGDLRIDLVFQNTDTGGVIVYEIKTGGTRASADDLAQVRAYVAAGAEHWSGAFLGVRLLYLRRPAASTFHCEADLRPVPLQSTPWWDLGVSR